MTRSVRCIAGALRLVATWMLLVSVVFASPGFGASLTAVSGECGTSCPCDEADHDEHASDGDEHADADPCEDDVSGDPQHDDGAPCRDQCPEDCPDCHCSVGVVLGLFPIPAPTVGSAACTTARLPTLIEAPASGASAAVFRPPRP